MDGVYEVSEMIRHSFDEEKYLLLIADIDQKDKYPEGYDLYVEKNIKALRELLGENFNNPNEKAVTLTLDIYTYIPKYVTLDIKYIDINKPLKEINLQEYDKVYVLGAYESDAVKNTFINNTMTNCEQEWYIVKQLSYDKAILHTTYVSFLNFINLLNLR